MSQLVGSLSPSFQNTRSKDSFRNFHISNTNDHQVLKLSNISKIPRFSNSQTSDSLPRFDSFPKSANAAISRNVTRRKLAGPVAIRRNNRTKPVVPVFLSSGGGFLPQRRAPQQVTAYLARDELIKQFLKFNAAARAAIAFNAYARARVRHANNVSADPRPGAKCSRTRCFRNTRKRG